MNNLIDVCGASGASCLWVDVGSHKDFMKPTYPTCLVGGLEQKKW